MTDPIPMADLEERQVYRIHSRNLVVGVWVAASQGFIGIREKFSDLYLFQEFNHEIGPPHGTAQALEALQVRVPDEIQLAEFLLDEDGGYLRNEKGNLRSNAPLFNFLRPYDEQILARRAEEREAARIEMESQRWAPQTREEYDREQRIATVRAWRDERLAAGVPLKEVHKEYVARLWEASKPEVP